MPHYNWKGITTVGDTRLGSTQASSLDALQKTLRAQNIALLSAKESQIRNKELSLNNQIIFFEHLASLLEHGISIHHALEIFLLHHTKQPLASFGSTILNDLRHGKSLTECLQEQTYTTSPALIALIVAGERTGNLARTIAYITVHLKSTQTLHNDIKSALLLPGITLALAGCIVTGLVIFVVPQFELLFLSMGKPLPAATRTLITISNYLQSPIGAISFMSMIVGVYVLFSRQQSRLRLFIRHHVYYLNKLFLLNDLIHCTQTLALGLKTGIPLTESLIYATETIHNLAFKKALYTTHTALLRGNSLYTSLREQCKDFIAPEFLALVLLGEQTGNLPLFIEKASTLAQSRLAAQLFTIKTVIQPIIFVIVGLLVGTLLIALYIPIFSLASLV